MCIGRTLLSPNKTVEVDRQVEVLDEEKNATLKEGETKEVMTVTKKFPANFQTGIVVATSNKGGIYNVGDTVVFRPNRAVPFELVADTVLVDDYDIIALLVPDNIVNNNESNE